MRLWVVAIVTLCGFAGCGQDPILQKMEADAAEAKATRAEARAAAGPGEGTPGAGNGGGGGVPGAAQPGDASGGTPTPMGPDGQPLPGAPGEPAPGVPEEPPPGIPGSPPVAVPGSAVPGGGTAAAAGAPRPGIPTEPAPGIPSQPPPGSGGGGPTGPTVKVSGEVRYPDWKSGKVKITAFDGDHAAGAGGHPKVIGMGELDRPGAFVVPIAEGAGKVYFQASIDEDGNGGPGPLEPQGKADRYPVTVGKAEIDGLEIVLTKREPPPGGRGEDF